MAADVPGRGCVGVCACGEPSDGGSPSLQGVGFLIHRGGCPQPNLQNRNVCLKIKSQNPRCDKAVRNGAGSAAGGHGRLGAGSAHRPAVPPGVRRAPRGRGGARPATALAHCSPRPPLVTAAGRACAVRRSCQALPPPAPPPPLRAAPLGPFCGAMRRERR